MSNNLADNQLDDKVEEDPWKEKTYKQPSVFGEAWNEMKTPLFIVFQFILFIAVIVGNMMLAGYAGHWVDEATGTKWGLGVFIGLIFLSVVFWWFVILVVANTKRRLQHKGW